MKSFSIKEALSYGWNSLVNNLQFFLVAGLILAIPQFFIKLNEEMYQELALTTLIIGLLSAILSIILQIGFTKETLKFVDNKTPSLQGMFNAKDYFWRYIGVSILYSLIVLGGLILLIIPGIIWAVKYSMSTFILIDTNAGIKESLRKSGELTQGNKWNIFLFGLVVGLVNMLGFMVYLVGLIVTIPLTFIAWVYVYRKLLAKTAPVVQDQETVPAPVQTTV